MSRSLVAVFAGFGVGAIALTPVLSGPPGAVASPDVLPSGSRGAVHAEAPPAGHTGGFGEPTCRVCHDAYPLNEPGGRLTLEGLPERYRAGETYALVVVLSVPETVRAGFQLSARFEDGGQAGSWQALDHRAAATDSSGIAYAHSTLSGTDPERGDSASWGLSWTAPREGGPVQFHLAANSANGDNSPFGDLVYATSIEVASSP